MLNSNSIKFIKSLQQKKFRREYGLFVAEGQRLVTDLLGSNLIVETVYHLSDWSSRYPTSNANFEQISSKEMARISGLSTPTPVLALVKTPNHDIDILSTDESLTLALDDIQDPGNLGTIIRLADWFGIRSIICSNGTAEAFAPKVVQATMGAIARVQIVYSDINSLLDKANQNNIPVYGTFLRGEDIYTSKLTQNGIIVLGNEGNGISDEIGKLIPKKITIPSFASSDGGSESLNVAMATAIVCSEFKRRTNQ